MLKELKNTMKETLSAVTDELKTKIKACLDKTIKNEIIVYDSVFTVGKKIGRIGREMCLRTLTELR